MIEEFVKFRKHNKLTQEGFARLVGMSRITIAKWECGAAKPSRLAKRVIYDKTGFDFDLYKEAEKTLEENNGNSLC